MWSPGFSVTVATMAVSPGPRAARESKAASDNAGVSRKPPSSSRSRSSSSTRRRNPASPPHAASRNAARSAGGFSSAPTNSSRGRAPGAGWSSAGMCFQSFKRKQPSKSAPKSRGTRAYSRTPLPLDADRIRRALGQHRRFGLKLLQHHFDGFLELRIAPGNDVLGRLFDFHVRRHAFVLDDATVLVPEGEVRRGDGTAIHQHGETEDADQPAPGAFADER